MGTLKNDPTVTECKWTLELQNKVYRSQKKMTPCLNNARDFNLKKILWWRILREILDIAAFRVCIYKKHQDTQVWKFYEGNSFRTKHVDLFQAHVLVLMKGMQGCKAIGHLPLKELGTFEI